MDGWIKMYRSILEWEWYDDPNTFRLFFHLLLKANSVESNWHSIKIKRGDLFTSVSHLASELKLSDKQIRISIDKLKRTNELTIKGANKGTLITICKYEYYQSNENSKGRAKGRTTGQNKGDKQEYKEVFVNTNTWRESFQKYLLECKRAFERCDTDINFISTHERLNPGLDIRLTMEKAFTGYWGLEAGWKNKKNSKTVDIDWQKTIINSLSQPMNKVYKQKQLFK